MNAIIQRLLAESSPFFKKLQAILVGILLLINLTPLHTIIPEGYVADINKIGIALIIFGAFTVKDGAILSTDGFTIQAVLDMAASLPDQLAELKDALAGKVTLDTAQVLSGITSTSAAVANITPPANIPPAQIAVDAPPPSPTAQVTAQAAPQAQTI